MPSRGSRPMLALGVSNGFTYESDATQPQGRRVVNGSMKLDGVPIGLTATYRVGTLNFLADGGDLFTAFTQGTTASADRRTWRTSPPTWAPTLASRLRPAASAASDRTEPDTAQPQAPPAPSWRRGCLALGVSDAAEFEQDGDVTWIRIGEHPQLWGLAE